LSYLQNALYSTYNKIMSIILPLLFACLTYKTGDDFTETNKKTTQTVMLKSKKIERKQRLIWPVGMMAGAIAFAAFEILILGHAVCVCLSEECGFPEEDAWAGAWIAGNITILFGKIMNSMNIRLGLHRDNFEITEEGCGIALLLDLIIGAMVSSHLVSRWMKPEKDDKILA
jgi:uncharacterized membrane protein YkvI